MIDAADEVTLEDISHDTWGSEALLLGALLSMAHDRRIAIAAELLPAGYVVAERKLLEAAHACMCETGWQLAPAYAARGSDGVLEAACAEVVEQVGELLAEGE
jgi:hypothetical protein